MSRSLSTTLFSLLAALSALFHVTTVTAGETAEQIRLQMPPASLAQWYKPQNKRQVWLHTMFRLRQALQAVELYADQGNRELLLRWAEELQQRYAELPEMVPEWRENTRQALAAAVVADARAGDVSALAESVKRLKRKCAGCHREWKGVVTALYRSPDYAEVAVPAAAGLRDTEFLESMEWLADSLNRIKIGREDEQLAAARAATQRIGAQLKQLKGSCRQCHRDPQSGERILGEATWKTLADLEAALQAPHDPKQSGHHLGTLGFTVCGRCHSIHRTVSDLRTRIFD